MEESRVGNGGADNQMFVILTRTQSAAEWGRRSRRTSKTRRAGRAQGRSAVRSGLDDHDTARSFY
ncbi:hypothetical protein VE04_10263, partial [Pseudogymnoascus sp. 24MN13]